MPGGAILSDIGMSESVVTTRLEEAVHERELTRS